MGRRGGRCLGLCGRVVYINVRAETSFWRVGSREDGLPFVDVVGVGTVTGVRKGPLAVFLDGVVGKCLTTGVLAVPHGLGLAVGEADHVVLPCWR